MKQQAPSPITIALIGGDGSGKSTLANLLLTQSPLPMKIIYMGANLESSNYLLPWSRLALRLKLWRIRRKAQKRGITDPSYATTHHMEHRQQTSSLPRVILRLSNRLLEVTYRHLVSWRLQKQGYSVIYDRHFLFDTFAPSSANPTPADRVNQGYYWLLKNVFPLPNIIIFLLASPEVMVARKNEATVDYLRQRNTLWLQQGAEFANFVCVDANQSIENVYQDTLSIITTYCETGQIAAPTIADR